MGARRERCSHRHQGIGSLRRFLSKERVDASRSWRPWIVLGVKVNLILKTGMMEWEPGGAPRGGSGTSRERSKASMAMQSAVKGASLARGVGISKTHLSQGG